MFSLPLLRSAAEPPKSSRLAGQAGASTILGRVRANKRPRLALCCLFSRFGMPWRPEFCLIGISGSYRKSGACASLPEARRALAVALAQGRQPVAGRPDLPPPRLDLLGRRGATGRDRTLGPRRLQGKGTDLQAYTCRAPRKPQVRHAPGGIRVTRHLAPPPASRSASGLSPAGPSHLLAILIGPLLDSSVRPAKDPLAVLLAVHKRAFLDTAVRQAQDPLAVRLAVHKGASSNSSVRITPYPFAVQFAVHSGAFPDASVLITHDPLPCALPSVRLPVDSKGFSPSSQTHLSVPSPWARPAEHVPVQVTVASGERESFQT